ncbi:MAG: S1 RNA-binding domain-containing protein, partial [Rhodospirillales bacterium]
VEGEIKNITEFGLFIGLPGDIDGMVHLSDLSWNRSGEEVLAEQRKGEMVRAKILDVDVDKERISLGVKQLEDDPFAASAGKFKKGDVVTCTVTAILENGIEVQVGDGLTGMIRKAELSRDRSEQRPDRFATGEKIDAKITQLDMAARRVSLSIRARELDDEKKAVATYGSSDSGASLGEILGAAIKEKRERAAEQKRAASRPVKEEGEADGDADADADADEQ